MADETRVVNAVNWREAFTFTHVFRAFRVAVHPSKLLLALAALLAIYLVGRCMDGIWPSKYRAMPGEIATAAYAPADLDEIRNPDLRRFARGNPLGVADRGWVKQAYMARLEQLKKVELDTPEKREKAADEGTYRSDVKQLIEDDAWKARVKEISDYDALKPEQKTELAQKTHKARLVQIYAAADAEWTSYGALRGEGLFKTFFTYEYRQVYRVVFGATALEPRVVTSAVQDFFITGPLWAFSRHPVYFGIFGVLFLAIWALFGGAISRIAAVHVARDEKISVKSALRFSAGKFLSFFFAPLIPIGIIFGLGVVVWLVSLALGNIPGVGPVLVGILFILALAAGFMMALVLLGLAGGLHMMYPTIAAEGSDSFDAISRSFSYLYARPWRLLLYTVVAIIYGAITFLFVRLFLEWTLRLTHYAVSQGILVDARNGQDWFDVAWPMGGGSLSYDVNWLALGGGQAAGAGLIAFWVYLTIALLGAFAISFYFSANTIIYFLMRREVDATELDDVYIEQAEEEFTEPAATSSTAAGTAALSTGAAATTSTAPATGTTTTTVTETSAPTTTVVTETPAPTTPAATTETATTPPVDTPPAGSTENTGTPENKPPDQPAA